MQHKYSEDLQHPTMVFTRQQRAMGDSKSPSPNRIMTISNQVSPAIVNKRTAKKRSVSKAKNNLPATKRRSNGSKTAPNSPAKSTRVRRSISKSRRKTAKGSKELTRASSPITKKAALEQQKSAPSSKASVSTLIIASKETNPWDTAEKTRVIPSSIRSQSPLVNRGGVGSNKTTASSDNGTIESSTNMLSHVESSLGRVVTSRMNSSQYVSILPNALSRFQITLCMFWGLSIAIFWLFWNAINY